MKVYRKPLCLTDEMHQRLKTRSGELGMSLRDTLDLMLTQAFTSLGDDGKPNITLEEASLGDQVLRSLFTNRDIKVLMRRSEYGSLIKKLKDIVTWWENYSKMQKELAEKARFKMVS